MGRWSERKLPSTTFVCTITTRPHILVKFMKKLPSRTGCTVTLLEEGVQKQNIFKQILLSKCTSLGSSLPIKMLSLWVSRTTWLVRRHVWGKDDAMEPWMEQYMYKR